MFVRVKNGLKIRDPLTKVMLPEEGAHVVESSFWHRRIAEGDVEVIEAPKEDVE
jgi:hypothetical protein